VILVVGEALVDLVIGADGAVTAALGGAPFNAARAAARLGAEVTFAGALSDDRFGRMLAERLEDDGVRIVEAARTHLPTTLAAAEVDASGAATYRFYFDGTSAPELSIGVLGEVVDADVVFTGGLALVLHPLADAVAALVVGLPSTAVLVVDVNARPAVISDRAAYLATVRAVLARADVVKVSDEDLAVLAPELDIGSMLEAGTRVVVVTSGSSPTQVVHAAGIRSVEVPPLTAPIVDTIGAGDTFIGAFMAAWTGAGLDRNDLDGDIGLDRVERAVRAGHAAAAIVVTRHGADPPTTADVPAL